MTDQGFGTVRPLPGNGLVAYESGLLLVCDVDEDSGTRLIDALRQTAASGGDGRALARRAAQVLAATMTSDPGTCAVAGRVGDGVAVLVSGAASAHVTGPAERDAPVRQRLAHLGRPAHRRPRRTRRAGPARRRPPPPRRPLRERRRPRRRHRRRAHRPEPGSLQAAHQRDAQHGAPLRARPDAAPGAARARPGAALPHVGHRPAAAAPSPAALRPAAAAPLPAADGAAGHRPAARQARASAVPLLRRARARRAVLRQRHHAGVRAAARPPWARPPQDHYDPGPPLMGPPQDLQPPMGPPHDLHPPMGPPSQEQQAAPVQEQDHGDRPLVYGVDCKNDHFNDPRAPYCAVCGIALVQRALVPYKGPRPALGVLVLDDGTALPLETDYLLGRDPERAPEVAGGSARPAKVTSPDGSVSRRHLRVALDGWDVNLVDLGSVNGTQIQPPGDPNFYDIPPNEPVTIAPRHHRPRRRLPHPPLRTPPRLTPHAPRLPRRRGHHRRPAPLRLDHVDVLPVHNPFTVRT
ncbi:FHA domain-containing protein [Nonomuraea ferruginea]